MSSEHHDHGTGRAGYDHAGHDHTGHDHIGSGERGEARTGVPWGLLLGLIGAVGICWLGVTGQLNLYIHPRYNVFTLVMASFAIVAILAAWVLKARPGGPRRSWGAALAAVAMVLALFVVPPATLSASTAQQRSPTSGVDADTTRLAGADPSAFTLRDWAALVHDPDSVATYSGQQVTLIGFVSGVDGGNADVFYLARFVVTCCTVDARPVAVPVALPDWADAHQPDQWVQITGRLVPAQDAPGGAVLVLQPSEITHIEQPDQPYEY